MAYRLFLVFNTNALTYDQQILAVLTEVGERGISVQALAKHVYNMNRTFFVAPDLGEIHAYVQQYLLRNSRSAQSLVERTDLRGRYRLNTAGSQDARQLMLRFLDEQQPPKPDEKPVQDLSLDLFA